MVFQKWQAHYAIERNEHEPPRDKVGLFLEEPGTQTTMNNDQFVFHEMHVNSWDRLRVYKTGRHEELVDSLLNYVGRNNTATKCLCNAGVQCK